VTEKVSLGYSARKQFEPFHRRKQRFSCIVAHRRAGKTVACIADLVDAALRNDTKSPRYAYVAPHYNQAKDVAWGYLKEYTREIPGVEYNESELRADLPGDRRIRLYGAENYERLRGLYFDGVVMDEFGDMNPLAWSSVIRPALSDRTGWAVFIGTPKGRNRFYELWQASQIKDDWFSLELKASETGIIPETELSAAKEDLTEDQYAQEFECSFAAAVQGAYYAHLIEQARADGRITSVPVEGMVETHVAFDLGIGDATSLWFCQQVGKETRIVDFYESSGVGLDHYKQVLNDKSYLYGQFLFPHDVAVRELGTGRSRQEVLETLGIRVTVVPRLSVDDGINAVRKLLPSCWFDGERCEDGLLKLTQYRAEYDEKRQVLKPRPLHDWTSHAADAFRYLAIGLPDMDQDEMPQGNTGWVV